MCGALSAGWQPAGAEEPLHQHSLERAHLNSVFLKQISRAHSDHRTERRWRCGAKAVQGSIAAITAGSSVVLHQRSAQHFHCLAAANTDPVTRLDGKSRRLQGSIAAIAAGSNVVLHQEHSTALSLSLS